MGPFGGTLGALQEPRFRLLWLGRVSSCIGDALIGVALAFAVLEVSGSATALGAVLACWTVSRVALTLVGGVYADRLPRREVMLACDGVRAIMAVFVGGMLMAESMSLPIFFVWATVFGGASAFFGPASTGLVPQTVSHERLQSANALLGLSQSTANVFGPLVSGVLVWGLGPGPVFLVDGVTFLLSAYFLARLRIPPHVRAGAQHFFADLAAGFREVRARPWVWAALVAFSITNLCFAAFLVLGPFVASDQFGGAREWGVIAAGGAVGAVLGGIVALRVRPHRPLAAAFTAWMACALPLLALAPPLPVAIVTMAYAVGLAGISFGSALWQTTLQTHIPAHLISRVSSYDWLVSYVFMPIGFVAFGPVADAVGIGRTLVVAGLAMAATNLVVAVLPPVRAVGTGRTDSARVRRATKPRAAA